VLRCTCEAEPVAQHSTRRYPYIRVRIAPRTKGIYVHDSLSRVVSPDTRGESKKYRIVARVLYVTFGYDPIGRIGDRRTYI
jgi:hypothetical protein